MSSYCTLSSRDIRKSGSFKHIIIQAPTGKGGEVVISFNNSFGN